MLNTKNQKTVAFDFDGVISEYHGFVDTKHVGEPIVQIVETMRRLKTLGYTIIVYSSRGNDLISEYCNKYDIPVDYINENPLVPNENRGKPVAHVYVDDRSVCFRGQPADKLVDEIVNFSPYWRSKSN